MSQQKINIKSAPTQVDLSKGGGFSWNYLEMSLAAVKEVGEHSIPSKKIWWGFEALQIKDLEGNELLVCVIKLLLNQKRNQGTTMIGKIETFKYEKSIHLPDAEGLTNVKA